MGKLGGTKTVEVAAPLERVWEIAADVARAPEWQPAMDTATVLETDEEGRATLVDTVGDATVTKVKIQLRFSYDPMNGMDWKRTKGDLKEMVGSWRFEELGPDRTRATYSMQGDPGRALGMMIRGPVEGKIRSMLVDSAVDGLKKRAESGS
jgi:ribosome-associated toxin RatA of RatAB toxin-antitoxin module